MRAARAVPCLALAVFVASCAGQPDARTGGENQSAASTAYDGNYTGTVKVTGAMSGADVTWCETDPRMSLQGRNSAFRYTQPHPKAPATFADRSTVTYEATVAADGAISGSSSVNGSIKGRITGAHMEGTLMGLGCFYGFAADRI
jgi:hypothetical protein